jgi:hypothetical protein
MLSYTFHRTLSESHCTYRPNSCTRRTNCISHHQTFIWPSLRNSVDLFSFIDSVVLLQFLVMFAGDWSILLSFIYVSNCIIDQWNCRNHVFLRGSEIIWWAGGSQIYFGWCFVHSLTPTLLQMIEIESTVPTGKYTASFLTSYTVVVCKSGGMLLKINETRSMTRT